MRRFRTEWAATVAVTAGVTLAVPTIGLTLLVVLGLVTLVAQVWS